ncbi:hypothetical protein HN903_00100 [archaeon]|jgi:hypothetical protein|nr:hypothetical protein [archaeon]MBT7128138.1 hypothetical protein [archaeon]
MVKMKKLKLRPSARDKRRYFLVRAKNSDIENAILDYVGVLGFAKSCYLKVDVSREKKWASNRHDPAGPNLGKGYMIGSCLVGSLEEVRAGLAFVGIRIEKVSGTLKGLREKGGKLAHGLHG